MDGFGNTGRRMDAAWKRAISEGKKKASAGIKKVDSAVNGRSGKAQAIQSGIMGALGGGAGLGMAANNARQAGQRVIDRATAGRTATPKGAVAAAKTVAGRVMRRTAAGAIVPAVLGATIGGAMRAPTKVDFAKAKVKAGANKVKAKVDKLRNAAASKIKT